MAVTDICSIAWVKSIKDAKTVGQMFYATSGLHLNYDEFFQARAIAEREAKIKEMEQKKKALNGETSLERDVTLLMQTKGILVAANENIFTVPEIKLLLKWKKAKPASSKKADLLVAYYATPPPPRSKGWTADDDIELTALNSNNINMIDTALGVATTQMARAV